MVKYELVKTLFYQSEEGAVEGKFIIGDENLWASRKSWLKYLIRINQIFLDIFQI